uniref:Uncharacterized protein n=1 Tax=Rhizophora mucronata TaxID=61149 RepID=A0A2P2JNS5_RHIMU
MAINYNLDGCRYSDDSRLGKYWHVKLSIN